MISLCEALAYHRGNLNEHRDQFSDDVRGLLERGERHTGEELALAFDTGRHWRTRLEEMLPDDHTFILTPTNPVYPPRVDDPENDSIKYLLRHTFPFSLGGFPSMSLPCGIGEYNIPVGMQLIGRDLSTLLSVGAAFQAETDWHKQIPPSGAS